MPNISPWQLLVVLLIVLVIFGTKKLRNVGGDLGSAIRDFRKGMSNEDEEDDNKNASTTNSGASESAGKSNGDRSDDSESPKS